MRISVDLYLIEMLHVAVGVCSSGVKLLGSGHLKHLR